MPDFDIDFCQDRRDEVIRYVQERYGRDQVAQIITFGTLQARGVLRDVGRVLEMPYGQVDKLCKLVPQNPAAPVTLAKAIEGEPKLQAERDSNPIVKRAFDIALKLEGLYRHASTHAAGIVIGDRPLSELVPMYRDPKSDMPVTQFNMKWVEQAGLVKFDFLGLKTLTVLQTAVRLLKQRGIELDLAAIPLDDKKTYDTLSRAEAVGIFQLESQGMRRALLDMRPDRFEDIIALVALYRPGPMANIPTYCARKHGDGEAGIHPSQARADPARDLRRHRLSGTGDAGRADPRRLYARPGRSAPPRHGQEDPLGDAGAAQGLRQRRDRARHRARACGCDLRPAGALRRIRLQQEPRRGLRAGRLPDRLSEGELSGGVHGGVDDARHGQHRQAFGIPRRGRAARHQGRAAVGQSLGRGLRGRGQHDLLRARGAQRRRPAGGGHHRRGARRQAVRRPHRFRPPHQSARGQQARAGKPRRLRRLRYDRAEPGEGARRRRRHDVDRAAHA